MKDDTMMKSTTLDSNKTQQLQGGKCDIDALNSLLRGEISAVETYSQALGKFDWKDTEDVAKELRRIHSEHQSAVDTLHTRVVALGGTPSEGSGAWGVFTAAVTGSAKVLGPHTTISALRQGEEHGVGDYEKAFTKDDISPECKYLLRAEQNRCKGHIEALDRLVEELKADGR
jgi:rubrerythrin